MGRHVHIAARVDFASVLVVIRLISMKRAVPYCPGTLTSAMSFMKKPSSNELRRFFEPQFFGFE